MNNRYVALLFGLAALFLCLAIVSPIQATGESANDATGTNNTDTTDAAVTAVAAPKIYLDKTRFDFGKVIEGFPVSHSFSVSNHGQGLLQMKAFASCGCTTPKLKKSELKAGETTQLDVIVDTAMKQDAVTKNVTIESNDPKQPRITIDLSMTVENPHKGVSEIGGTKIFDDKNCAACHVARGEGKFGRDLFNADCAMCHGPKAEGAVGPALFGPYGKEEYAKFMREVLESGSKKHRSMPGFSNAHGGPLDQKQVDSLLQYLSSLSTARGL